jgi:hypothetical protein
LGDRVGERLQEIDCCGTLADAELSQTSAFGRQHVERTTVRWSLGVLTAG